MPDRYGEREDDDMELPPRMECPEIEAMAAQIRRQRSHLTVVRVPKNKREEREVARQQRILDQQTRAVMRAAGIPRCTLCDDDGYTATGLVCDHVDRRHTYARGKDLVRAAMGWTLPIGKPQTATRPPHGSSPGPTGLPEPNPHPRAAQGRSAAL